MRPALYLKVILFLSGLMSNLAWANIPIPIQIESDQASYFHHEGKMIHEGHVVVHWGDRTLLADRLVLIKDPQGQIKILKAYGTPAFFEGQEEGKTIQGKANTIEYTPNTHQIHMLGQAELTHLEDKFSGPEISLNTLTSEILAQRSSSQRPVLIFQSNREQVGYHHEP